MNEQKGDHQVKQIRDQYNHNSLTHVRIEVVTNR